jgi:lysophospholipase L1-like esterase
MSDPRPFIRGCAFAGAPGVPYPRALPADADRLPADTWNDAIRPVGVRLELTGDADAVDVAYETAEDAGARGPGTGTEFEAWCGQRLLASRPISPEGTVRLPVAPGADGDRRVVIYLPEAVRPTILDVAGVGGDVEPAPAQRRWLCYGDSITGGWVVSGPGRAWPAVAGRRCGLDTFNLGYAGAARGEIVTAEELSTLEADVVTLAHGTNCWSRIPHSARQMAANLAAFLDLIRSGHANTPIVVASPVVRPDAEQAPNRLGATLQDLRQAMEETVEERLDGDPNLSLLRGGPLLSDAHLVDGIHPGDEGHEVLARAMGDAVLAALRSSDARAGS